MGTGTEPRVGAHMTVLVHWHAVPFAVHLPFLRSTCPTLPQENASCKSGATSVPDSGSQTNPITSLAVLLRTSPSCCGLACCHPEQAAQDVLRGLRGGVLDAGSEKVLLIKLHKIAVEGMEAARQMAATQVRPCVKY